MDAAVVVCLLGSFRVFKGNEPVTLRQGGKGEQLLGQLALRSQDGLSRDAVLGLLWPDGDCVLAGQSLNTLVYSLHRLLGDSLDGHAPVIARAGRYRLNTDAGIGIDIDAFDIAVKDGDQRSGIGDQEGARASYLGAVALYTGDLAFGSDVLALVERERLRSRYLMMLSRLADTHFVAGEFDRALGYALEVLGNDPCREDAHRMAMRCFVRLGARAQAFRQYQTCCEALEIEFAAVPELATESLYEQLRLDPAAV